MHSLRRHNPEAHIVLVTDAPTYSRIDSKHESIKGYISETVVADVPETMTPIQRSRYLKTSLRQRVEGDFLYLDVDTVIMRPIGDRDFPLEMVLGGVKNVHFGQPHGIKYDEYIKRTGKHLDSCAFYPNGGVLFARDVDSAHEFFNRWHDMWIRENRDLGIGIDQPSLAQANSSLGCPLKELPGTFNCQTNTRQCKEFLFNPYILHYYAAVDSNHFFPFKNTAVLEKIRLEGITPEIERMLDNPQLYFFKQWIVLEGEDASGYNAPWSRFNRNLSRRFPILNKLAKPLSRKRL